MKEQVDCPSLELALEYVAHQNKVPCLENEAKEPVTKTPRFRDWMVQTRALKLPPTPRRTQNRTGKSSMKNVKSPFEPPRSSARLQNRIARSSMKNGSSSSEPPKLTSLISAASRDWIGPNKEAKNKPPIPTKTTLSGSKRKATSNDNLQFIPHNNPSGSKMTKKPMDELCCEICQISCSSALTLGQHLIGRPHKAKLKFMQIKRNGDGRGSPRCDTCQIWCSDWSAMDLHLKGQKHKAKLEELNMCKRSDGVAKKPMQCEVCKVNCMNDDLFEMHLKGRQHATRQELKRRGMV